MATAARPNIFEPVHDAHAIEHVIFTLQFDRPIDDASVQRIKTAMSVFADALPGQNEIRAFGMAFGPQGVSPLMPSAQVIDGFVRTRVAPNGAVEKELRVERTGLFFRSAAYTRWIHVWGEARRYFSAAMAVVDESCRLAAYGLQYVDKFVWQGAIDECRPSHILRTASEFVSPHAYTATDLWHSHSGFFKRANEATKRLLVVNVDCTDENELETSRRVVRVTTSATDMLNQANFAATNVRVRDGIGFVDPSMDTLHNLLVNVMGQIITPELCRRIDLRSS
jgi:uncharacterized protein (TIGR04255 family)